MSEQDTNNSTDTTNDDAGKAPEVKPGDVKALPQWAQDLISNVRGEAANWRTQLREAQDALGKAKSPEDVQKATEAMEEKVKVLERDLLIERIARENNLPDDLKSSLRGDDEKALKEHAATLAKYVPKSEKEPVDPENLSGGLDPNSSGDAFDPVAEARKARATRY